VEPGFLDLTSKAGNVSPGISAKKKIIKTLGENWSSAGGQVMKKGDEATKKRES